MAQVKHTQRTAQKAAATTSREFRTFLLMAQFEAREIGARIEQARKEKGLTQEELAEMASFSKRSLQDYERGETIPYRHFRELGRLLERPTEWFLYGDADDPRPVGLDEVLAAVEALRSDLRPVLGLVEQLLEKGPARATQGTGPGS